MKSILMCLHAPFAENVHPPACSAYGISLASKLGAHLSVVMAAPKLQQSVFLPVPVVTGLLADNDRVRAANAATMSEALGRSAVASGITMSTETLQSPFPSLQRRLLNRAHIHELVLVGRPGADDYVMPGLIESLIFESGRPVMLVDSDHARPAAFERIVVAWDGSARAGRAVWDALPLLKQAQKVEIVSIKDEKDLSKSVPGAELAPALARHGIDVTVTDLMCKGDTVANTIKAHVGLVRADLLVMGAFGHNRWRELILGGVTEDLLRAANIPVLMSR
ncbi:MAG TPA: universal stress protein [Beijerinckiaceae bacterium]|nr:universal stress protein [Beijerinckiaceae bacterium]